MDTEPINLLWISEVPWCLVKQRHHHLMEQFPEAWNLLYAEPFTFQVKTPFLPRRTGRVRRFAIPLLIGRRANRKLNERFFAPLSGWYIRFVLRTLGMRRNLIVITSNVYAAPFVDKLKAQLVCFDCHDNPEAFPSTPLWIKEYVESLSGKSDIIFTSSKSLQRRFKKYGSNVFKVGNGCNPPVENRDLPLPSDMKGIPKPIVGYVGVFSEWFDYELIHALLEKRPDISVVLVGPVEEYKGVRQRLSRLLEFKNAFYLGSKTHEELAGYISRFDIGIIPFLKNELTLSVNPIKVYEYAAAGIPIVSTDFSEDLHDHKNAITLAHDPETFIQGIQNILSKTTEPDVEAIKNIAYLNSWKSKAGKMIGILDKAFDSGAC